jgi:hypothetical protein
MTMASKRIIRRAPILLCILATVGFLLGSPASGQDVSPSGKTGAPDRTAQNGVDLDASIQAARQYLKDGEYERAAESLRPAISKARNQITRLRQAYLLLIVTYVYQGNSAKMQVNGLEASRRYYAEAKRYVIECLSTRELRDTSTEPATDYPPEMVELFADVRRDIFGTFRILRLLPPDAVVTIDGDTLQTSPGGSLIQEPSLQIGAHTVTVNHPGYGGIVENIRVNPGDVVERSFELKRRSHRAWYSALAVAAAGGTAALLSGKKGSSPRGSDNLPEPPSLPH